ncbi:MAG: GNAT family N-acetyltransferase [Sphingobacteriaceae bacterium]|nr:GNAT family N-acetyltransferase [Sphingobacteriaceae bacterium]
MQLVPFNRSYLKTNFDCGHPALNNYLLLTLKKELAIGACTCFVLIDQAAEIKAYYTLSTQGIPQSSVPDFYRPKTSYEQLPVILLGRLAVDRSLHGEGWGKTLLADALKKSLDVSRQHIGAIAVVVDPIDGAAKAFYRQFGFIPLVDSSRMFMSMRQIENAFSTTS